jgi:hypothetical protein
MAAKAKEVNESAHELDAMLTVLARHGVSKFTRGVVSVEFFPGRAPVVMQTKEPPPGPPPVISATEAVRIDLEDLLPPGVK